MTSRINQRFGYLNVFLIKLGQSAGGKAGSPYTNLVVDNVNGKIGNIRFRRRRGGRGWRRRRCFSSRQVETGYSQVLVFVLGLVAFATATAFGVLFGKLMNKFSKVPINPMIGAAGVSAVPMSARVVQRLGQQANPRNFLLMHAMGPNLAGVIGTITAAGIFISMVG